MTLGQFGIGAAQFAHGPTGQNRARRFAPPVQTGRDTDFHRLGAVWRGQLGLDRDLVAFLDGAAKGLHQALLLLPFEKGRDRTAGQMRDIQFQRAAQRCACIRDRTILVHDHQKVADRTHDRRGKCAQRLQFDILCL